MLQITGKIVQKVGFKRYSSTVSSEAIKKQADQTLKGFSRFSEPIIYYGRVGVEFLRQVAVQQKLGPPSPAEWGTAQQGFINFKNAIQSGAWKKLSVAEAGQYGLKALEVLGFFYVGEIIGRRSLIGYNVSSGNHGHGHH